MGALQPNLLNLNDDLPESSGVESPESDSATIVSTSEGQQQAHTLDLILI